MSIHSGCHSNYKPIEDSQQRKELIKADIKSIKLRLKSDRLGYEIIREMAARHHILHETISLSTQERPVLKAMGPHRDALKRVPDISKLSVGLGLANEMQTATRQEAERCHQSDDRNNADLSQDGSTSSDKLPN